MEASEQCGRQRRRANRVYRAQPSGTLAAFSQRLFPNYSAGKSQGMLVLGAEICWMYAEPILHDLSSLPRLALRAKRSGCLRKIHYSHVTTFTSLPHNHPLLALTLLFLSLYLFFIFYLFSFYLLSFCKTRSSRCQHLWQVYFFNGVCPICNLRICCFINSLFLS